MLLHIYLVFKGISSKFYARNNICNFFEMYYNNIYNDSGLGRFGVIFLYYVKYLISCKESMPRYFRGESEFSDQGYMNSKLNISGKLNSRSYINHSKSIIKERDINNLETEKQHLEKSDFSRILDDNLKIINAETAQNLKELIEKLQNITSASEANNLRNQIVSMLDSSSSCFETS